MVRRALFLALILIVTTSQLLSQEFSQSKVLGGEGYDVGVGMAIDKYGNYYCTYFGGLIFGNSTNNGCYDIYISKFKSTGGIDWLRGIGGPQCDYTGGIFCDDSSNIYVSGVFSQWIDLTDTIISFNSERKVVTVKYDSSGNLLWAKPYTMCNDCDVGNFEYSSDGFYYTMGSFNDTLVIENVILHTDKTNHYIAKFNLNGGLIWVKKLEGVYSSQHSIKSDRYDNLYLVGTFAKDLIFNSNKLVSNGSYDAFILKLDKNGSTIWQKSFGGYWQDKLWDLDIDGFGNIYTVGEFGGDLELDGKQFNGRNTFSILKFDSNGIFQWIEQIDSCSANCIAVDSFGSSYVAGSYWGKLELDFTTISNPGNFDKGLFTRYSPNGQLRWVTHTEGDAHCSPYDIVNDGKSHLYVTGRFDAHPSFGNGTMILGDDILTPMGAPDVFVTRIYDAIPLGINNLFEGDHFNVYPNPNKGEMYISHNSFFDGVISLYNLSGLLVFEQSIQFENNTNVNLPSDFASGLYFIKLVDSKASYTSKIIIQR